MDKLENGILVTKEVCYANTFKMLNIKHIKCFEKKSQEVLMGTYFFILSLTLRLMNENISKFFRKFELK